MKSLRQLCNENPEIEKLQTKWALQNHRILEEDKDKWNFGIIVRNHTRDFIDNLLKLL